MKHYAHAVACVIALVYFTCFVPADAVQLDRKKLAVASNHGLLKKVHKLVKRSAKGDGNHAKKVVKDQDRVHHTLKAAAIGKTQNVKIAHSPKQSVGKTKVDTVSPKSAKANPHLKSVETTAASQHGHISAPSTPTFKVNQNLFVTNSELEVFTSKKSDDRSKRALTPKGDTVDRAGRTYLCPSGHFSAAGGKCEPCLAGTFSEAGSSKCRLCGKGSFSDSMGQASCTPCPSGLFNPKEGGRDAKVCQKCPSGFACESEQLGAPKPCADGKYSPVGTTSCKACPTFFSPNSLQSSCKAKTSFYIATSSLSFAFFGLIGIMSGRIKKASKPITLNGSDSEIERDEIISFEGIDGYRINHDDLKTAVDRANSEHFGVI